MASPPRTTKQTHHARAASFQDEIEQLNRRAAALRRSADEEAQDSAAMRRALETVKAEAASAEAAHAAALQVGDCVLLLLLL